MAAVIAKTVRESMHPPAEASIRDMSRGPITMHRMGVQAYEYSNFASDTKGPPAESSRGPANSPDVRNLPLPRPASAWAQPRRERGLSTDGCGGGGGTIRSACI